MKRYLLFDLDGTLTDSKEGITTCVQYALADFGIDEPDLDKLEPFIGPPLKDSFMEFYHMTEEQADAAVAKYRERFQDKGIFENQVYPGIYDLLRTMKAAGMHMAVVSSKPTVYVERILKHFKLDQYFEVVLGSELDGTRSKKAQVLIEVLRKFFGEDPIRAEEVYMIGDRKYDVEGARAFHVESVGVTYGYGSMEELKEAKADYIVQSVAELKKLLMREVDEIRRMDEVHSKQQPGGGKKPQNQGTKVLWRILLPYLLFVLSKSVAGIIVLTILQNIAKAPGMQEKLFVELEEGTGLTGLSSIISQIVAFVAAGLMILKHAKPLIAKTAEEMHLTHLKQEPVKNYIFTGIAAVGGSIALNVVLNLAGLSDMPGGYALMKGTVYAIPLPLGLIAFVLCAPLAEEMLFRGIVYNWIRRGMTAKMALLLSAIFYGYYSGGGAQMIFGFLMGLLLGYVYEYFGDFRVAVAVHMVSNLISYLMGYTALAEAPVFNWPVCAVSAAVTGVSVFLLMKQKKIY